MNILLRSFGLSVRDIFHPRILWLSIRPFAITGLLWLVILWFSWTPMLDFTKQLITESWLTQWLADLIVKIGWDGFRGAHALTRRFFIDDCFFDNNGRGSGAR